MAVQVLAGEGYDCVIDMIGPGGGEDHTVPRAAPIMAPQGRFISITTGDDEGAFDGSEKVFEHIVTKSDDYRDLDVLRDFVEAGALKPVVASRFTLEELGEACESWPLLLFLLLLCLCAPALIFSAAVDRRGEQDAPHGGQDRHRCQGGGVMAAGWLLRQDQRRTGALLVAPLGLEIR